MLDEDVQSIIFPLNLMQYMTFCPKYRIKNGFITPNSYISNFVSMIATLFFMFLFLYRNFMMYFFEDFMGNTQFTYFIVYFDCVFYISGFLMNLVAGITQTRKCLKFVTTFQKVHLFLNSETDTRNSVIWNWITVVVYICTYIVVFVPINVFIYLYASIPFYNFLVLYIFTCFDMNVIYAIRLLKLLEYKVNLWNFQALKSRREDLYKGNYIKRMFQAYVDILQCYDIQQACSRQYILYYIAETFIHALLYIQMTIEILKRGNVIEESNAASVASLSIYFWILKDLTGLAMYSVQCEKFYIAIQNVQDTCSLILQSNRSDDEKKLCKNVLRLHRASFSKIRLCGLFYVDVQLQLSLMENFASYTIVLLQFAIS